MEERRRTPRIKEENAAAITVVSGENNLPKEKIIDNYTKDISVCGAKIQTNILLPVDTILELDFTSKGVRERIKALGKVKWVKVIIENESYEAGVEFVDTSSDAIKKLGDYISWKLKAREALIKKNLSPIGSGDITIVETKERHPIVSGDITIVETKERPPIVSGDVTIVKTKEQPPIKNKRWIKIAIISLGTIILIVVLLKIYGFIPEFDGVFVSTPKATLAPAPAPKAIPAPAPGVTPSPSPALEAKPTPAPEVTSAPALEATQHTKVIGNRDSKRYHLPGMKYYDTVKPYHRVEFDSEADAIKAGYSKAPR